MSYSNRYKLALLLIAENRSCSQNPGFCFHASHSLLLFDLESGSSLNPIRKFLLRTVFLPSQTHILLDRGIF